MSKELQAQLEERKKALMEEAGPLQEEFKKNSDTVSQLQQRNSAIQVELVKLQGRFDEVEELLGTKEIPTEEPPKKKK